MQDKAIVRNIVTPEKTYSPGMESEIEKDLSAAQIKDLTTRGALAGEFRSAGKTKNETEGQNQTQENQTQEITLDSLSKMKRADLEALANEKGIDNPAGFPNIGELAKAVFAKTSE